MYGVVTYVVVMCSLVLACGSDLVEFVTSAVTGAGLLVVRYATSSPVAASRWLGLRLRPWHRVA